MLRHYIKVSIRNLLRDKTYSLINIFGLATSVAACLLIFIYVYNELGHDKFHLKGERIYQLRSSTIAGATELNYSPSHSWSKNLILERISGIKDIARIFKSGSNNESKALNLAYKDKLFGESKILFTEPSFFRIFDFKIFDCDRDNPLDLQNGLVITQSMAKKYFGSQSPIGKQLTLENVIPLQVTAVVEDVPYNSHFKFDFLTTMNSYERYRNEVLGYVNSNVDTSPRLPCWYYVLLNEGANPNTITTQINSILEEIYIKQGFTIYQTHLTSLSDIFYDDKVSNRIGRTGNFSQIIGVASIGIIILLIACVNFINLATARSMKRAKEVGLKKVLGVSRSQLISQFLGESILISLVAILIALGLTNFMIPVLNNLTDNQALFLSGISFRDAFIVILSTIILLGVITGLYPAFYLSRFLPIQILTNTQAPKGQPYFIRNSLVVIQMVASLTLTIGSTILYFQLEYIHNKDIGYDKNSVIVINTPNLSEDWDVSKMQLYHELSNKSYINKVGLGPSPLQHFWMRSFWNDGETSDNAVDVLIGFGSFGYLNSLGLQLMAGRNFDETKDDDITWGNFTFIVNETAANAFGWNAPFEEKKIKGLLPAAGKDSVFTVKVIGIVKDFNIEPLQQPIKPLIIMCNRYYSNVVVNTNLKNLSKTMSSIERDYKKYYPDQAFNYSFLDEDINSFYKNESSLFSMISLFTLFAIGVACIGLVGLISYTIERRTKEIAIRRVLGANIKSVTQLLNSQFAKLILISALIAIPIDYILTARWLERFAYHIEVNPLYFAIPGSIQIMIILSIVGYFTLKLASVRITEALKHN